MGGEWRGEGRRLTCIFVATSSGGILMGGTIVILKSETMKLVGGQGDDSGYIHLLLTSLLYFVSLLLVFFSSSFFYIVLSRYVSPFKDLPNIMQQIGGLEKEFCEIFRRAFVLRLFPPSVLRAMKVKPVKGFVLFWFILFYFCFLWFCFCF